MKAVNTTRPTHIYFDLDYGTIEPLFVSEYLRKCFTEENDFFGGYQYPLIARRVVIWVSDAYIHICVKKGAVSAVRDI